MLYTIPDYYKEFHCTADQCEDTCCAGWQIVIDKKSLKNYKKECKKADHSFAKELHQNINWRKGIFRQDQEKRCAFLNQENLCNLYLNLGEKSLCKTCRLYPRHVEEFEGVREITLSVSCPEVARMLLERTTPVSFRTYEKAGEESYDDFDPFLFSLLQDAREGMLHILQDRTKPIAMREGLILGMAHDIQGRVNRGEMFSCYDVIERYQTKKAADFVENYLKKQTKEPTQELFAKLYRLEFLKEDWAALLAESEALLYGEGEEAYWEKQNAFVSWQKEQLPDLEIHLEQLLVYFIFTYFAGAVYDGKIYAKVSTCVSLVVLIRELWIARWLKNENQLNLEDMAEILYRFSREVEHSDENLKRVEELMGR